MDVHRRKPPSAARFRITMVIVVLLVVLVLWFGMPAVAHILASSWDRIFNR